MTADRAVLALVAFATAVLLSLVHMGYRVGAEFAGHRQPCGIGWAYENEVCP